MDWQSLHREVERGMVARGRGTNGRGRERRGAAQGDRAQERRFGAQGLYAADQADGFRRGAPGAHRLQLYARTTEEGRDRKSTRLNSSHGYISYAVFCLKKKKN